MNGCLHIMFAVFATASILQGVADGSVQGEHGAQASVGDRLRSLLSSGKPFLDKT